MRREKLSAENLTLSLLTRKLRYMLSKISVELIHVTKTMCNHIVISMKIKQRFRRAKCVVGLYEGGLNRLMQQTSFTLNNPTNKINFWLIVQQR